MAEQMPSVANDSRMRRPKSVEILSRLENEEQLMLNDSESLQRNIVVAEYQTKNGLRQRKERRSIVASSSSKKTLLRSESDISPIRENPNELPGYSNGKAEKVGSPKTDNTDDSERPSFFLSLGSAAVGMTHSQGRFDSTLKYANYKQDLLRADRHFRFVSVGAVCCWLTLVTLSYWLAPPESLQRLTGVEQASSFVAFICLTMSVILRMLPFLYNRGSLRKSISGVIIGAITVQCIAMATNFAMVFAVTPVFIDPVTGGRVHMLRWCEWTPLAFTMTFLTEGADVPEPEWGLTIAYINALCMGLSTICGWLFPLCPGWRSWTILMVISCLLYLFLFPRLYFKVKGFKNVKRGNNFDVHEIHDRARLSLHLLVICTIMWSLLTAVYFIANVGPMFAIEGSIWKDPAVPMVAESVMDVITKVIYMFIIVDIHDAAFDPAARTKRRLEELRRMMNAVWENSSDVLVISVKGLTGHVTTMVSPTFVTALLKGLHQDVRCSSGKEKDSYESRALVFELPTNYHSLFGIDLQNSFSYANSPPKLRTEPKLYDVDFSGISLRQCLDPKTTSGEEDFSNNVPLRIHDDETAAMVELVCRAWQCEESDSLITHNLVRVQDHQRSTVQCEAKVTRLDESAVVIVLRDISERFKRFEAEKRVVSEMTARQKDAEANRFTRHEVKNGLLASIGLCDSLKDTSLNAIKASIDQDGLVSQGKLSMVQGDIARSIIELDKSLHEILDTILSEAMARDVIHEVYTPKLESVDFALVLQGMRGLKPDRFPVVTNPSPLPLLSFDPQLLKYIYRNAVSNACKYGKKGGTVTSVINYDPLARMIEMNVINLPGQQYEEILKLDGRRANEIVFGAGQRLEHHIQNDKARKRGEVSQSSGDGAWIMQKCAKTLGGDCFIDFQQDKSIFTLRCPATPFKVALKAQTTLDPTKFQLPEKTWAIGIDDSKIQRKLLERMFKMLGVKHDKIMVMGKDADEIRGFNDFVVDFIDQHSEDFFFLLVDENLDVVDDADESTKHSTVSGSLCVQTIRHRLIPENERRMLALVRSANDSSPDIAVYNSRAHGFIPKAPLKKDRLLEMLAPLWEKRYSEAGPETKALRESGDDASTTGGLEEDLVQKGELMELITEIDGIIGSGEDLNARWFLIWERLHKIKGDVLTIENIVIEEVVSIINDLRGPTLPDTFQWKWGELRRLIVTM